MTTNRWLNQGLPGSRITSKGVDNSPAPLDKGNTTPQPHPLHLITNQYPWTSVAHACPRVTGTEMGPEADEEADEEVDKTGDKDRLAPKSFKTSEPKECSKASALTADVPVTLHEIAQKNESKPLS